MLRNGRSRWAETRILPERHLADQLLKEQSRRLDVGPQGGVDLPGEVAHDLWGEHFFKNELEQRLLKANPVDLAIILAHDSAAIAVSRTAVILARVAPPVHAR